MADEVLRIKAPDLERVGRLLKQAPPETRKELTRSLRAPATRVAARQRAAARALAGQPGVPKEWAAQGARDVRVDVVLTGRGQRVMTRVRRSSVGRGPWLLNRGKWRHPYYGDRERWYEQRIARAGWFDATGKKEIPQARTETARELDRITRELARQIDRA